MTDCPRGANTGQATRRSEPDRKAHPPGMRNDQPRPPVPQDEGSISQANLTESKKFTILEDMESDSASA